MAFQLPAEAGALRKFGVIPEIEKALPRVPGMYLVDAVMRDGGVDTTVGLILDDYVMEATVDLFRGSYAKHNEYDVAHVAYFRKKQDGVVLFERMIRPDIAPGELVTIFKQLKVKLTRLAYDTIKQQPGPHEKKVRPVEVAAASGIRWISEASALPIKKGSTVAIQVDTRKWYLGTIATKGTKTIKVDTFDGQYALDAEDADDLIKPLDLSGLKIMALKKAMKGTYNATQLKALIKEAAPAETTQRTRRKLQEPVSAPVDKVPSKKPRTPPEAKPKIPELVHPLTYVDTDIRNPLTPASLPKALNDPDVYKQTPYGRILDTGRKTHNLGQVVIVGTGLLKGKPSWIAYPHRSKPEKAALLYLPMSSGTSKVNNPQVAFADLQRYRDFAHMALNRHEGNRADIAKKGVEVSQKIDLRMGDRALIKFSNMDSWHTILEVDHTRKVIYIQGSGSKRRTIPFALIIKTVPKDPLSAENESRDFSKPIIQKGTAKVIYGIQNPSSTSALVYKRMFGTNSFRPHSGDTFRISSYSENTIMVTHVVSNDIYLLEYDNGARNYTFLASRGEGIWEVEDPNLPSQYRKYT